MTLACPACGSTDTRYRERRADWFCDACDHAWVGEIPAAVRAAPVAAFISYGRADASKLAVRLKADLDAHGVHPVWLDSDMIAAGGLWTVDIERGIRTSDVLLAIMSPHALRSDSICHDEVALAVAEHKRVVPVRATADPALTPSLLLVRRSWVDFSTGYEAALERLLRAVAGDESGLVNPLSTVAGQRPMDFAYDIAERSRGFVGRAWLDRDLDAWLAGETGRAFVIVGEPGIGKSAIAAHLAARPDAAAVHFCSTGNRDTLSPLAFTANLVAALSARVPAFGAEVARRHPAERREDAVTAFRQLVIEPARSIEPPQATQLIIIDALDEAATREGETIVDLIAAHASALPAWLRLVVTTRPEAGVTTRLRYLAPVELGAARLENLADLNAYVVSRLGAASPDGAWARVPSLLAERAAGNFLYARMATDALERGTLSASDLRTLPPGIDAFYALAFAKTFPDERAYVAEWAPLLRPLAVAVAPVPFDVLRAAMGIDPSTLNAQLVHLRSYLKVEGQGDAATYALYHRSLVAWLTDRDLSGAFWCDPAEGHVQLVTALDVNPASSPYAVRCLPRHLAALRRWEALVALLADAAFLEAALAQDRFAVRRSWAALGRVGISAADTYGQLLEGAAIPGSLLLQIGELLHHLGLLDAAMRIYERLVTIARSEDDRSTLRTCLESEALALYVRGDFDGALALHREEEQICREVGDMGGLGVTLGSQALILATRGDLDGALALYVEAEKLFRELGDQGGLATPLGSRGNILYVRGDLDEAMVLHREEERICRELGNKDGLQISLNDQGLILRKMGNLADALELLREAEELCRELGNKDGLQRSLDQQGSVLYLQGDLDGALALHCSAEALCRELGNRDDLWHCLGNQATILCDRGDTDGAMRMLGDAEHLARELGSRYGLQGLSGNQADVLVVRREFEPAMALYRKQEELCRELGIRDGLASSLLGQGRILAALGGGDEAGAYYAEAEEIARHDGTAERLVRAIELRAELTSGFLGRPAEALPLVAEAYALAHSHGFVTLAARLGPFLDDLQSRVRS